jgi:predicted DNA-binding transcriptional regulator YafY
MKLLYLIELFTKQTDEHNHITINDMIQALATVSIKAERKSLYSDIQILRRFGLDIEQTYGRNSSYYLASREYELAELKLLVDAVQSSHFITQKKSNELIDKLSTLTSAHQAKQLKRQVNVVDKPKSINESIYYNVDAIHSALSQGRKISFKYFDYDQDKKRSYRKSGSFYTETPLTLCWNDEKYYLICFNSSHQGLANYRVDRMSSVSVSEEPADSYSRRQFNVNDYIRQTFGMFGGETVSARLRFDNSLRNVVLDRYGNSLKFLPVAAGKNDDLTITDSCFEIEVKVTSSPVFLGWMAGFGKKAEIIRPENLRQEMIDMISELAAVYSS